MHLFGYIDPGSGLLIWQMIVAACVGALFYFKKLRVGIMKCFRKLFDRS